MAELVGQLGDSYLQDHTAYCLVLGPSTRLFVAQTLTSANKSWFVRKKNPKQHAVRMKSLWAGWTCTLHTLLV